MCPMYDLQCQDCGAIQTDIFEPVQGPAHPCVCGSTLKRAWLSKPPAVIGDEIDVWIKNGLCNPDRTPKHFRSRLELAREAKRRGFTNVVDHHGGSGSDKSRHTTRWI